MNSNKSEINVSPNPKTQIKKSSAGESLEERESRVQESINQAKLTSSEKASAPSIPSEAANEGLRISKDDLAQLASLKNSVKKTEFSKNASLKEKFNFATNKYTLAAMYWVQMKEGYRSRSDVIREYGLNEIVSRAEDEYGFNDAICEHIFKEELI